MYISQHRYCYLHFHQYHNAPCLPPKILHKHCFQFLLEKLKTMFMQHLAGWGGGGLGVKKMHYRLSEDGD